MARISPHLNADYDLPLPQIDMRDGVPYATQFADSYYNADDGLAETRHIFLDGNELPARMKATSHLTIGETGFGTGLNLLVVMDEMQNHPHCQIDYVSFEAQPMDAVMMAAAHAAFPQLAGLANQLRQALPPRWPGYHLVVLCGGRLTLHLHYGDMGAILPTMDIAVDYWFLDGFAPARNPSAWTADILSEIGRLTAIRGSFSTFTAAGDVRRGLTAAGFAVEKSPGYGRKRDMIRGVREGAALPHMLSSTTPPMRIAVIGAGIAGAALAAGLSRRGATPVLLDAATGLASGASGNRAALQSPRLSVDHNAMSRLSAACLSWAARCSDTAGATLAAGVLALDAPERMAARHTIFRQQRWPASLLRDPETALDAETGQGIFYEYGRAIRPSILVKELAEGAEFYGDFNVASITMEAGQLLLGAVDGRQVQADAVVLAGGSRVADLLHLVGHDMLVEVTRGQVSHVPATSSSASLATGVSFGGYLTPSWDGLHEIGATFSRDLEQPEDAAAAHAQNFALLPAGIAGLFDGMSYDGLGLRTSHRASLADRRPVAGRIADNIWMFGGLGARGFTLAPLLGEMLAARILNRPVPLARDQRAGVAAARYLSQSNS